MSFSDRETTTLVSSQEMAGETTTQQAHRYLQKSAGGLADGQGGHDPRTAPVIGHGAGKKSEYEEDQDDLDYQKEQLKRAQARLMRADTEHIKATINSIDDIESGVWAAPFFGAFAAMRFLLMTLCGQLVTIISVVFSEGGLAFPAWICFSLGVATLVTGFPTWWEPMTNNHARLHIITAALAAVVTGVITIFLAEKFEIADARQRGRVVGLYAGLAVLEFLGCFFAVRVRQQTANVDLYVRARLIEWRHDVEKGVFQTYVSGGRRTGATGLRGEGEGSGSEDDERAPLVPGGSFRDPQLAEINRKIEEMTKRNNFLEGTASGLQDLLNASKKREKEHLQQNLVLVAKAQRAEDLTRESLRKLETFEKDMRYVAADQLARSLESTNGAAPSHHPLLIVLDCAVWLSGTEPVCACVLQGTWIGWRPDSNGWKAGAAALRPVRRQPSAVCFLCRQNLTDSPLFLVFVANN